MMWASPEFLERGLPEATLGARSIRFFLTLGVSCQ